MTRIHLAGQPVTIDGRTIQRCLICGQKLCDGRDVATWRVASWIVQKEVDFDCIGEVEDPVISTGDIPTGCCLDLVE